MARKSQKRNPIKKLSSKPQQLRVYGEAKAIECKCGRIVENCNSDVKTVTCHVCVAKLIDPPEWKTKPKPEEERPRGWHFMKRYVSPTGKVYHKGREVDESVAKPAKGNKKRDGAEANPVTNVAKSARKSGRGRKGTGK